MVKKLRKLSLAIKDQKKEEALKTLCELVNNNIPEKDIIYSVVKDVIPILYRNQYQFVPHGLMGISCAVSLSQYVDDKFLPLAQAIWYLANENKLAPLDFSVYVAELELVGDSFDLLEQHIKHGDIPKTYKLLLGLIKKHSFNDFIKGNLFNLAMQDTINVGHKAIYCMKMFELIESLDSVPANIHYPYSAYIASTPKDYSVFNLVEPEYLNLVNSELNFDDNNLELTDEESDKLVQIIISGFKSKVISYITELLNQNRSIQSIADNIMIAAAILVLNTDHNEWLKPVHGFNYCHSLNKWIRCSDHKNRVLALYLGSVFLNVLSVEHKKVHFDGASFYVKHKNILNNIIKSIITSNISDTVCLTKSYLLSNLDDELLIKNLAMLAVQNDSLPNFTHDMKFAVCAINEYKDNKTSNKPLILVALAKHLSQSPKDYSCYNLYKTLII